MEKESGHNSKNRPGRRVVCLETNIWSRQFAQPTGFSSCAPALYFVLWRPVVREQLVTWFFRKDCAGDLDGWGYGSQQETHDHVNNGLAPRPAEQQNIGLSDSMCVVWGPGVTSLWAPAQRRKFATASLFLLWGFSTTTLHFPYRKTSQRLSVSASSQKSLPDGDGAE